MYTRKNDWMNNYLANANYYVSDHPSYGRTLALHADAKVSLRFFGNVRTGYFFLLVINAPYKIWTSCLTKDLNEHLDSLKVIAGRKIPILFFSDDDPDKFCVAYQKYPWELDFLNSDGLKQFFSGYGQCFLRNVGNTKSITKTVNDLFMKWTRDNLSKYLTFNDIDAFWLPSAGDQFNVIELKRLKSNSCGTWLPFLDDASNYKAGNWMSSNLKNTNFKTIAYCKMSMESIVFLNVSDIEENMLSGKLYRGSLINIDLEKLACLHPMTPFTSRNRAQK